MAKYPKKNKTQIKGLKEEAMKIARSRQLPDQTKEQTKLIAQGIEKGIEQYLRQRSEQSRELDKTLKKAKRQLEEVSNAESNTEKGLHRDSNSGGKNGLVPWMLLVLSWIGFAIYQSTSLFRG